MANWLAAIDPDEARRREFVTQLCRRVAPIAGLDVQLRQGTGWSVVWAAAKSAPVQAVGGDGSTGGDGSDGGEAGAAILWGEARDEEGALLDARAIRNAWREGAVVQWDGFYAAVVLEQPGPTLTVGTDVLGIFPVYHWTDGGEVVLTGTSPELFRWHPRFEPRMSEAGLVGILLTNGLVDGQSLWRDVRRLGPGRRLRVQRGRVWEDEGYELPQPAESVDLPLAGHAAQLAQAVGDAVRRHTQVGRRYGMLLSGGLDSRMIAGFLRRVGITPAAFTIGLSTDLEMRCAQAVARLYEMPHQTGEPKAVHYPNLARLQAQWEHLGNGFNTIRDWWVQAQIASLGERVITGGLADSLVGAMAINWAYADGPPRMSYDLFREQMPKLGISSILLTRLLGAPRFDGVVGEVESRLRAEFLSYGDRVSRCAWRYDLAHGQRFHVGGSIWRLSFGAWPVVPMLDRKILAVAAAIPASSMAGREAQIALVHLALPELARVPLDRSDLASDVPQFLEASLRQQLRAEVHKRWRRALRATGLGRWGRESRYWYRVNHFTGEAWTNARRAIEPQRAAMHALADKDLLDVVLPPPGTAPSGPWVGESGRKLLLGLLYWMDGRMDAVGHG